MFSFGFFQDPRYRQERIFCVLLIPGGLVLMAAMGWWFIHPQVTPAGPPEPLTSVIPPAVTAPQESPLSPEPVPAAQEPSQLSAWISEANQACEDQNQDQAHRLLEAIPRRTPLSAQAWELVGRLHILVGDQDGALNAFASGLQTAATPGLHYWKALLHRTTGQLDLANQEFQKALALSPRSPVVANERYLLLIQMGKATQVRQEITNLLSRSDQPAASTWIFGLCGLALHQEQFADAATLLHQARPMVDSQSFAQLLENPVILRHQTRPEIFPFYIKNLNVLLPPTENIPQMGASPIPHSPPQ